MVAQHALGERQRRLLGQNRRQVARHLPLRLCLDPPRAGRCLAVIAGRVVIGERSFRGKIAVMAARLAPQRLVLHIGQHLHGPRRQARLHARPEFKPRPVLDDVDQEALRQRLDQASRRGEIALHIAREVAAHFRHVVIGKAMILEQGCENIGERARPQSPVQPVAGAPVRAVGPEIEILRKGRLRPRIPGPQEDLSRIDHARRRCTALPMPKMRFEKPPLLAVGPRPAGEIGQRAFRRFRIAEHVRLVSPLVDRGAAEFGEPERLHPRRPGARAHPFRPADPVEVEIAPPPFDILEAKHPGLARQPVADR